MISNVETRERKVRAREQKVLQDERLYNELLPDVMVREEQVKAREIDINNRIEDEVIERTNYIWEDADYKIQSHKDELNRENDERRRKWHLIHDGADMALLCYVIIYSLASASAWNEDYASNVIATLSGIKHFFAAIGKGIWQIARWAGEIGNLIPNDKVSIVVEWIVTVIILAGIAALLFYILIWKMLVKLIAYWKDVEMWDIVSLIVAAVLLGLSAIIPATIANWFGIAITIYVVYIFFRSIWCMKETETRNTILRTMAYASIIVFSVIGIIYMLAVTLTNTGGG